MQHKVHYKTHKLQKCMKKHKRVTNKEEKAPNSLCTTSTRPTGLGSNLSDGFSCSWHEASRVTETKLKRAASTPQVESNEEKTPQGPPGMSVHMRVLCSGRGL